MQESISPASRIEGMVILPGDKAISHRYGMLGAIAEGKTTISNYSTGQDCQSTLACMSALGAKIERDGDGKVVIEGGLLHEAARELDAGNSGSTIRMLSGILAAQPFTSRIGGDESLSRRPMGRIIKPLSQMGACIEAREGGLPPLKIVGRKLKGIDYALPVASAQVKTSVLFAGLFAEGETIVREPVQTRDHTEIALREFGADLTVDKRTITLRPGAKLTGRELVVPGDISSACFFLVAAMLAKDVDLVIQGVGLNPTRAALLDFLVGNGAVIHVHDLRQIGGELIGNLRVKTSKFRGGVIEGALTAGLIDEIPALAVAGVVSENGLTVRDAAELRVKETDRIATIEANMKRMGIAMETAPDGFHIPGKQKFRAAEVNSAGDHRIAMAFAVAGLAADGVSTVVNADSARVSFPEFFATLRQIAH
jgi:3-phosphoshikimate 1-carboxyvinyltransferase